MDSLVSSTKDLREKKISIFYNLFQNVEAEELLPNLFYEVSIALTPKADKKALQERKLQTNIPYKPRCKYPQQIISKSNTTINEKNYIPQLSGIYPRYSSSNIQKVINVIHHINRVKKKNHIIISLNTEKHLTKSNTHS